MEVEEHVDDAGWVLPRVASLSDRCCCGLGGGCCCCNGPTIDLSRNDVVARHLIDTVVVVVVRV